MQDEFMDVVSSSPALQEGFRRILEERKVGEYSLPVALTAPHVDAVALALASQPAPLVLIGTHQEAPQRNPFQYERPVAVYELGMADVLSRDYLVGLELVEPDKGLPEWQKRRNASARSKQALIAKLKKGRR